MARGPHQCGSLQNTIKSGKLNCQLRAEVDVRFGSKADICAAKCHVRFVTLADIGLRRELLGECGGDGRVTEAPSHDAAIGVVPPVPALRPNAASRVKVIHGVQLGAETTGRHGYVHEVRVLALDGPRASAAFVAVHGMIYAVGRMKDIHRASRHLEEQTIPPPL